MKIRLLKQENTNAWHAELTVSTEEMSRDGRTGVLISRDDTLTPYQRNQHNNATSKGIRMCYVNFAEVLKKGKDYLAAATKLPHGRWMLAVPAGKKLSDIATRTSHNCWELKPGCYLLCIDCGHRTSGAAEAAEVMGEPFTLRDVPVQLWDGLTVEDQALLFLNANKTSAMQITERINAAFFGNLLKPIYDRINQALTGGYGNYTHDGKTCTLAIKSKVNKNDNAIILGRWLTWMAYGMTNRTSVADILEDCMEFSQEAVNNVIRVQAIFAEEIGYRKDASVKLNPLSSNVFQSVIARIVVNHPFGDKVTDKTLTEDAWRFFFRYLRFDENGGHTLLQNINMVSSGGGSGRKALYDWFTACPENCDGEIRRKRSCFAIGKQKGGNTKYYKVLPKFGVNHNPEMLVSGTKSLLWNPESGEDVRRDEDAQESASVSED